VSKKKLKLSLYGGVDESLNKQMNIQTRQMMRTDDPLITFVPAMALDADIEFQLFVQEWQELGVKRFLQLIVDLPIDEVFLAEVLKSDMIFLGGGNTFYFLHILRKFKMLPLLKQFINQGGILAGVSAGAIIMTPSIHLADYPEFDKDDNFLNLKNFKALNLVPLEIFPHYVFSKRYREALRRYSLKFSPGHPIYGLPDGSGLIVQQNLSDQIPSQLQIIGPCEVFFQGSSWVKK